MSISHYVAGELDEALASAQTTLALAETFGDLGLQGVANQYLGFAHSARTDYRRATECFGRAIGCLQGALLTDRLGLAALPSTQSRGWNAWCLAELGAFAEAIALGEEGIRIAEAVAHPSSIVLACWGTGQTYLRRGDLALAVARLEQALRLNPLPLHFHYVAPALGSAYVLSGRPAEGLPLLEQAVERDSAMGFLAHHALSLVLLGEAYLVAGRVVEAEATANRAVRLARQRRELGHEAYAVRLLADLAAYRDVSGSERYYEEATALANTLGMRPLVAHCHLGLGKLYRRTGKREQAEEHLTTATTMYREMDMRYWLEQVERELRGA